MRQPIPFMEHCRQKYGSIFSIRLGPGTPVVMVADPTVAKEILSGDPEVFRAGDTNGLFRPVVGSNSILLLDGQEHMRHRRMLLPAFSAGHGRQFAEQVREIAERRVSTWEQGQRLKLQDEMEAISFESILRVAFGDVSDPRQDSLRELIPEMMDRCGSPFTLIPWFRRNAGGLSPYARLMRVIDKIDAEIYEMIAERRADPLNQVRGDALALLMQGRHQDNTEVDDVEIRDELLTLIMAGYETTTSGLAWAFERLLHSPLVLQQLLSELDRDDEYLDAVVKETLRCRPVVPVVARRVREPVVLSGHSIPAGAVLMVSIYLVHNDPEAYPDPQEFRPERFLGELSEDAAWIPFGGGVRRCLGASFAQLEMKLVLREVLTRVRLGTTGGEEAATRKRFTFAPGDGASAVVEELLPAERSLAERRRFPAASPGRSVAT
jgi:cytochrome P450